MEMSGNESTNNVFEYLIDWEQRTRKPVFRVAEHGDLVIEEAELRDRPGIEFNLAGQESETWLKIERLKPEPPPYPPEPLNEFISLQNDPDEPPGIHESIEIPLKDLPQSLESAAKRENALPEADVDGLVQISIADITELKEQLDQWIREDWQSWSEQEKPRRETIQYYGKLFGLQKRMEEEGSDSPTELVWGFGRCIWKHDSSTIDYPLLSKRVEIELDDRLNIVVRPTQQDPIIETERLERLGVNGASTVHKYAKEMIDSADFEGITPFDHQTFSDVALAAANHLDEQGEFYPYTRKDPDDRTNPRANEYPRLNDTTVIFARRRSTQVFAEDVRRLQEETEKQSEPPPLLKAIVAGSESLSDHFATIRFRGLGGTNNGDSFSASRTDSSETGCQELYFPLPYNREQVEIAERLEQSNGVIVQGPPGTGKSHTIANIICHYLANGKRVLVTSKGESALEVLREHLPAPLRSLAISLLTSEREGLRELERSVSGIAHEITRLDRNEINLEIQTYEERLEFRHHRITQINNELRDIAELQIEPIEIAGKPLSPEEMAQWVVEHKAAFNWFTDRPPGPVGKQPFTEKDLDFLKDLRMRAGDDLLHLGKNTPKAEQLPSTEEVTKLHRALLAYNQVNQTIQTASLLIFETDVAHQAKMLFDTLNEYREISNARTESWHARLYQDLARDGDQPVYIQPLKDWIQDAQRLVEQRRHLLSNTIEMSQIALSYEKFHQALERASCGKKPTTPFSPKDIKIAIQGIRLNGEPPVTKEDWQTIRDAASLQRNGIKCLVRWDTLAGEFEGPSFADVKPQVVPKILERIVSDCTAIMKLAEELDTKLPSLVRDVFGPEHKKLLDNVEGRRHLERSLSAGLKQLEMSESQEAYQRVEKLLGECDDPISKRAKHLLNRLGDEALHRNDLEKEWHAIREDLLRVEQFDEAFKHADEIIARIRNAGAPNWARKLTLPESYFDTNENPLPSDASEAWVWAQAYQYLNTIDERDRLERLTAERLNAHKDLARAYQRIVELRTWLAIKTNTTSDVSSALQGYLTQIKSLGKGTGKNAPFHRRIAQEYLKTANQAVPCWIMPHYRVSESLPSHLGSFDLVIIDEASQSDAWALPSLLRGKQVLVVGDDNQVSPSAIGVAADTINKMHAKHLQNALHGSALLPNRSIYDLSSILFAQHAIRLREHFRCVEPIINFSSREFYDREIQPLRVPKPSERLEPPLIDVFVEDGARNARQQINKAEAQAIANEVKTIVEDPSLKERTIGVITLLGHQQADLLRRLIYQAIGSDAWEAHQLHVGEPSSFQGREADIVMLSMIVSPEQVQAATNQGDRQRFNVAASRARDRMYVFHSVRRSDLKDNDLRARLLDHLTNPIDAANDASTKELREHCESNFERAFFDALIDRGYRVTPQVKAGSYRIDLVVEGNNDAPLAVELDGDQYHIDRWMQDMHRQQVLERMGWQFWRCWGSSFTLDPDGCLNDLEQSLAERGITPTQDHPQQLTRYTGYSTVRGFETSSIETQDTNAPEAQNEPSETVATSSIQDDAPSHSGLTSSDERTIGELSSEPTPPLRQADLLSQLEGQSDLFAETDSENGLNHDEEPRSVAINDVVVYSIENQNNRQARAQISAGRSNNEFHTINQHSPVAQALLGASVNDVVKAEMPSGEVMELKVLEIERSA